MKPSSVTLLVIILWFISVLQVVPVQARTHIQEFKLSEIRGKNISPEITYYRLPEGFDLNPETVQSKLSGFKRIKVPNMLGDRILGVFRLYNDTKTPNWFYRPYGSVIEFIEFSLVTPEKTRTSVTGFKYSIHNAVKYQYGDRFELDHGQSAIAVIHFHSDSFFAPIKITLAPESDMLEKLQLENLVLILCIGTSFCLVLYNLFLFFRLRRYVYFWYTLQTVALVFSWSNMMGVVAGHTGVAINEMTGIGFIFASLFFLKFCKLFFDLEHLFPRLYKVNRWVTWGIIACIPIPLFRPDIGILVAVFTATVSILLGLIIGLWAIRAGYKTAGYFIAALLPPIVPGMLEGLANLNIISSPNINIYLYSLVGHTLLGLLLAFALLEQLRLISDKDRGLLQGSEKKFAERKSEEALRAKPDIPADLNHEIRTPMNAIIGMSHLCLKTNLDLQQREYIGMIYQSANLLMGIINNMGSSSLPPMEIVDSQSGKGSTSKEKQVAGRWKTKSVECIEGVNILIVDDNDMNKIVAKELLTQSGMVVTLASNGEQAISALEFQQFDAVLMDIQMPVMNGYEATLAIRKIPDYSGLPIIAMTANATTDNREKYLKAGMNDMVVKPIEPQLLFETLVKWIPNAGGIKKQHAKQVNNDTGIDFPDLEEIEVETGLRRTGNDPQLYINLMADFLTDHGNDELSISKAVREGDYDSAYQMAHALKGVSGGIGAVGLFDCVQQLELYLKHGLTDEIDQLLPQFNSRFKSVIESLGKFINVQQTKGSGKMDRTVFHSTGMNALLDEIEQMLEELNPDAEDKTLGLVRMINPDSPGARGLAEKLTVQTGDFEFDAALATLKEIRKGL